MRGAALKVGQFLSIQGKQALSYVLSGPTLQQFTNTTCSRIRLEVATPRSGRDTVTRSKRGRLYALVANRGQQKPLHGSSRLVMMLSTSTGTTY